MPKSTQGENPRYEALIWASSRLPEACCYGHAQPRTFRRDPLLLLRAVWHASQPEADPMGSCGLGAEVVCMIKMLLWLPSFASGLCDDVGYCRHLPFSLPLEVPALTITHPCLEEWVESTYSTLDLLHIFPSMKATAWDDWFNYGQFSFYILTSCPNFAGLGTKIPPLECSVKPFLEIKR